MKWIAAIFAAGLLASPVVAQDDEPTAEQGGSFIERQLEDLLSGAGREVAVSGFEGALSSTARLDEMTISDDQGVWLILRDAELDWNRSALIRGRLEVNRLRAAEIRLPRLPDPPEAAGRDLPAPEATPFALPDLPVSIEIGELSVGAVTLGAPVLGEEATISLDGQASLAGGEGAANLTIERIDGTEGRLALTGSYENATEALTLDLSLSEPEGGIAARLLDLPGRPSVDLAVAGSGVLSDFAADLSLATGGDERLAGTLRLVSDSPSDADAPPDRRFEANLGGDLAPVFAPEFAPFFGDEIRLTARGTAFGDGRLDLDSFELGARSMQLSGNLSLDERGSPDVIRVEGAIASPDGRDVALPVGSGIRVGNVALDLGFDAATGPDWTGEIVLAGLDTPDGRIDELALTGSGRIDTGGAGVEAVTADLDYGARGLALADAAAQQALGPVLEGAARISWQRDAPVVLDRLRLEGESVALNGSGRIDGTDAAFTGDVEASDLAAFSGLAGRPLGGTANLSVDATTDLGSGAFDIAAEGRTTDLAIAQDQFDRTFAGRADLELSARRDETGTTLETLNLITGQARLSANARLTSEASSVRADLQVEDAAGIDPRLDGPATVALTAEGAPDGWDIDTQANVLGADLSYVGRITDIATDGAPLVSGRALIDDLDLARLERVAGRPLSGMVSARIEGEARTNRDRFDLTLDLSGQDVTTGIPEADVLLAGASTAAITANRSAPDQPISIERLAVETPRLTASASGSYGAGASDLAVSARLSDVAPFAPGVQGPASAEGRLGQANGRVSIDLAATGPGGIRADVSGSASPDFRDLALDVSGSAPLALANRFIAPQSVAGTADFDLALNGPLGLAALSGRVSTTDARAVLPGPAIVFEDITATVDLGGGRATVALDAAKREGGRVTIDGSVGLTGNLPADLTVQLRNAVFQDPALYRTQASGEIRLSGPIRNGATASGRIDLGTTEIRVPSTGLGLAGPIPDLVHLNPPASVQATRARAGLTGNGGNGNGRGAAIALDIDVVADNRIFVRGRGLDAELGGRLALGGTNAAMIPSGRFDLIRGRLDILGQRLNLDEGSIVLRGDFTPLLQLVARTESDDGTVLEIILEGPADAPEITFASQPELPEDEVLARLLFGKSLTNISPLQAARLANAAATLAGRGGEGIVGRLRSEFGLSDLDITTDGDGNAAVRAGLYLSENLYSDVTVSATGETEINLNLDITPSLRARGRVTNSGETGIGLFYERDY